MCGAKRCAAPMPVMPAPITAMRRDLGMLAVAEGWVASVDMGKLGPDVLGNVYTGGIRPRLVMGSHIIG